MCSQCNGPILDRRKNKKFCSEACRQKYVEVQTHKGCRVCSQVKAVSEFSKAPTTADRLSNICKKCVSDKWREWYYKDHDTKKQKNAQVNKVHYSQHSSVDTVLRRRLSRYGLSNEEFTELVDRSEGLCEICRTEPFEAIDHCHSTGRVRGLLCGQCNRSLGGFRDDATILKNTIKYVMMDSMSH